MSDKMVELMGKGRLSKNNPVAQYNEKYIEIEQQYDSFNIHQKVKDTTGQYKTKRMNKLVNDQVVILINQ